MKRSPTLTLLALSQISILSLLLGCNSGGDAQDLGASATAKVDASASVTDGRAQAQLLAAASDPAQAWSRVSIENGSFDIDGTRVVRFGADTRWVQRSMTGPKQWCTAAFFGGDPAPGVPNVCEVATESSVSPPVGSSTPTWTRVARENGTFDIAGTKTVRFGADTRWVQRPMTGPKQWCTVGFFGTDPAPGVTNTCEVAVAADLPPPPPPPPGPPVDTMPPGHGSGPLPAAAVGFSTHRVQATTEAPHVYPVGLGEAPEGAFRIACGFAHFDFNDQIVYPGQANKSHLHTYFGAVNRALTLTADELLKSNTTCNGGVGVNHSKYWVPSMIDMTTNKPIVPDVNVAYYKTGYGGVKPEDIQPIPKGLRMIAGNPANTAAMEWGAAYRWRCFDDGQERSHKGIPSDCAVGTDILMEVFFPQCWDGVNLDSPDHKSHMAHGTGNGCPSTHPVALPALTFNIHYTVRTFGEARNWRLSSDVYAGQAGHSAHGDVFFAWNDEVMSRIVRNCHRAAKVNTVDCKAHLLGDGLMIY